MGSDSGGMGAREVADGGDRRHFLRKAAMVGTGAFAVPMIITVDSADAPAITSPPPQPPGSTGPPAAGVAGPTGTEAKRPTPRPGASGRRELPRIGAEIDRMVATGLAAAAGGAALLLWSADMKASSATLGPADPEPEA